MKFNEQLLWKILLQTNSEIYWDSQITMVRAYFSKYE